MVHAVVCPCSLCILSKGQPDEESLRGISDGPTMGDGTTRADDGTGRALGIRKNES